MGKIKECVVVSGKGGTGKTSLTASLASLFADKIVADCDVDAANLHMILVPEKIIRQKEFTGGKKATIDSDLCTQCGLCRDMCRFGAISPDFSVDPFSCEGCGACHFICPSDAADFSAHVAGYQYVCDTLRNERFVFAELLPGQDNSGKLVAAVRADARTEAESTGRSLILIDGPPGIGCPVISSVTGTDLVVVVTEPTPTGIHDLERVFSLTKHFGIKTAVVVNKCDINLSHLSSIKNYCAAGNHTFLGEIPYESAITEAQRAGKTILDFNPVCNASVAIGDIYKKLNYILEEV
jgi:MinD superfamily P-loop ATPase